MRFGLFVPPGWRHDLVGIEPAGQWATMSGLATHADVISGGRIEPVVALGHTSLHATFGQAVAGILAVRNRPAARSCPGCAG